MPLQLIFTSAPQGLTPGRSGYATVARHRALPDRLAQLLEAVGTPHESPTGETFTFRRMEAGGQDWFVLSRFVARGLDYTRRDNRLAHHVVFTAEECAVLPPPAAWALRWEGWCAEWTSPPTWLEGADQPLRLETIAPLSPAIAWRELTGTGAKAAWLVNASGPAASSLLNPPPTATLLRLLAESAALLGPSAWAATFTTDARLTGAQDFGWAVHGTGAAQLDFATAKSLPAPTGEAARQAAAGLAPPRPAATTPPRPAAPGPPGKGPLPWVVGLGLTTALVVGFLLVNSREETPAPTPVAAPLPAPVDLAKADEILRANRALVEIQSLLEGDEYLEAGGRWLEATALSPDLAKNYREQIVPRLRGGFAASVARQALTRLDHQGIMNNPKTCQAVHDEIQRALKVGTELAVPADAAWRRLEALAARALRLRETDVRPVLLIPGEWRTGDSGPNAPSQADFKLGANAAARLAEFVGRAGVTARVSVTIRLRLLPLTGFHLRDDVTPYLGGEIRRGPQKTYLEANAEPGKFPAITIDLGPQRNSVSLIFADSQGAQADVNRLLEIELPGGGRQCIALLGDAAKIPPLDLGADALVLDPDTGVVRPASWAENAVNAFLWTNGSVGLYPSGHEFPDRELPSVRATRSLLDTDLIRLENKQGPGTPPYEEIARRRRQFKEGKFVEAGLPWALQAVDGNGAGGPRLLEFR